MTLIWPLLPVENESFLYVYEQPFHAYVQRSVWGIVYCKPMSWVRDTLDSIGFSAMTVMLQVTERMLTLEVRTIQPAILYPNMTDITEFPL